MTILSIKCHHSSGFWLAIIITLTKVLQWDVSKKSCPQIHIVQKNPLMNTCHMHEALTTIAASITIQNKIGQINITQSHFPFLLGSETFQLSLAALSLDINVFLFFFFNLQGCD